MLFFCSFVYTATTQKRKQVHLHFIVSSSSARVYPSDSGLSLWKRQDGELPVTAGRQCQRQNQGRIHMSVSVGPPAQLKMGDVSVVWSFFVQNGYTPLHQAAQQGNTHIINMLLQHGAKPNATTVVRYKCMFYFIHNNKMQS